MTTEACVTKLAYLLERTDGSAERVSELMAMVKGGGKGQGAWQHRL